MGKKVNYFVHINRLIGIMTTKKNFSWPFGTCEPNATLKEYEKCRFKIRYYVESEKDILCTKFESNQSFGNFSKGIGEKKIRYHKSFFGFFSLCYEIEIQDKCIIVRVGRMYEKIVKYKLMNIHPIRHILFDIITYLLLMDGCIPLYCSSFIDKDNYATVMMAPPNTGKTQSVIDIARETKQKIICEDMSVTDGKVIWASIFTKTFRNKLSSEDEKNFVQKGIEPVPIERLFILERGNSEIVNNFFKKAVLINRYGLGFLKSPILSAMEYFFDDVDSRVMLETEQTIFKNLGKRQVEIISSTNPSEYTDIIKNKES